MNEKPKPIQYTPDGQQICTKCQTPKEPDAYYNNPKTERKFGICKECKRAYANRKGSETDKLLSKCFVWP